MARSMTVRRHDSARALRALAGCMLWSAAGGFLCPEHNVTAKAICDVPQGLAFCGDTSYSSCMTEQSWEEQEAAAVARMDAILELYGYSVNRSEACFDAVRRFQCATQFSVCEGFESLAEPVCPTECDVVREACKLQPEEVEAEDNIIENLYNLDEHAYAMICAPSTHVQVETETSCFELDYTGPSYYLWAIGLGLAVGFSFLNAVALNLQKMSLNSHGAEVPVIRQPLWISGFFLLLLGSAMDFVALGLAPASLLAPLAALSLVWNMIAAPCFLKEKLSRLQILATMVIFAGAVVTVVFASHTSPAYTLDDLKALFLRDAMAVYTVVVPLLIMLHMVVVEVVERLSEERREERWLQTLHMLGYAGAAGITGGQSILFAKAVVELFKSAIIGVPGVGSAGETYLIITGMVFCLLVQITYLNGGLMYHNSLTVVPVYQAYWIISGVIGGLVYFDEIRTFSSLQLAMFTFGVLVTIAGVAFLAVLAHKHQRGVKPGRRAPGADEDFDDGEHDEYDEEHIFAEENAFDAYLNATPRAGAAEVLLDMGVEPSKVRRIVGNTNVRLRTQRQKELALTEMGVRPEIAAMMLRSASDRTMLQQASIDEDLEPLSSDHTGLESREVSAASIPLSKT